MATKKAAAETARDRQVSAAQRAPAPPRAKVKRKVEPEVFAPVSTQRPESKKVQAAKAKLKIPKKVGAVADMLYLNREGRLEKQHEVDDMAAVETVLKNHLIDTLPGNEASGTAGKVARVQLKEEQVPRVEDWDLFYKHLKKTGDFDLLNRALNVTAVRERWENNKTIPGVGSFTVTKVSVTKV